MAMTIPSASSPLVAATCIISAMALIGLIDNLVILIAERAGLWQLHLLRSLMALPMILVISRAGGWLASPKRLWAVALRSLLVSISMVFYFGSLAFLPVAQAAAGLFTAPIFVLLLSVVALRRRVGLVNAIAVGTGFLGILVVLRPDFGEFSFATVMPVAAGVFYALGAVATRNLCAGEGTLALLIAFFTTMLFWGTAGCVGLSLLHLDIPDGPEGFLLRGWVPMTWELLALVAIQAVGSVIGVGLIIRGYLLAEASFVAVFEYTLLVFAAFWGYVLWSDRLDMLGTVGIALIVLSGGVLAQVGRRQGEVH